MPDGDVVYHGVGRGFGGAYKALAEGYFETDVIAEKIAKALRQSIRLYGDQPVNLLLSTVEDVSDVVASGTAVDYASHSQDIDQATQNLIGHRRGMALAAEVGKANILDIVEGRTEEISLPCVLKEYVRSVLNADFLEHLPLLNHHYNADPESIAQRLREIHPLLEEAIEQITDQLARGGSMAVRKKPHKKVGETLDFEAFDVAVRVDNES